MLRRNKRKAARKGTGVTGIQPKTIGRPKYRHLNDYFYYRLDTGFPISVLFQKDLRAEGKRSQKE